MMPCDSAALSMPDQPEGQGVGTETLVLRFASGADEVRCALGRAMPWLGQSGLGDGAMGRVELVLAEALNNICEHAYTRQAGPVVLTLWRTGDTVHAVLRDQGQPMPGGILPDGRLHEPAQDLQEGGWGWFLIRELCQDLHYLRSGDGNSLWLTIATSFEDA